MNLKDIGTKTHNSRSQSAPSWSQNYLNLNFKNHKNRTGTFFTIEIKSSCLLERKRREGDEFSIFVNEMSIFLYIRQKSIINGSWSAPNSPHNNLNFTFITFINRIGWFWLLKLKDHIWFVGSSFLYVLVECAYILIYWTHSLRSR